MLTTSRAQTIRRLLEERKRRLMADLHGMIRDVRQSGTEERSADEQDVAATDTCHDVDLAVLQMKAETMLRIDSALRRLDEGGHGDCLECGVHIAAERLKALPFALRCRDCEESRERALNSRAVRQAIAWPSDVGPGL